MEMTQTHPIYWIHECGIAETNAQGLTAILSNSSVEDSEPDIGIYEKNPEYDAKN